ncbi:replicative DNA helicase [Luteibacter yeojuensis]|uniref:DNA 5'-3' helicase n=1 Tax=Luteibacter yeojuensis TaxID=345309 RepID=A0A7X5TQ31_9GAMM|nr:replicative DNA helicase [Luteibacter yeojuensis]NID15408.1 replicative DNA helicase [Luteibacter yeojuensis]
MSAILPEIAVLGCCMAEPKAYWQIAASLAPEDFTHAARAALFAEIAARAKAGQLFDAVTIGTDRPELNDLAMDAMLAEGWRVSNVAGYAERVAAQSLVRRLRQAGARIANLDDEDPYGQAQKILAACAPRNQGTVRHIREFAKEAVADLQSRYEATEELTGLPTGIPELDEVTGGFQAPDLVVIAARPSVGKTAMLLQVVRSIATAGKATAVFSLEMSGKQLTDRLTSAVGVIDGTLLRRPKAMDESDWGRWARACEAISGMPIYIDDTAGVSVEAICARTRQLKAQLDETDTPLGAIAIDYLQLIKKGKAENTTTAIGDITAALKNLAKELNIVVILLSQLNREAEGKEPNMSHLRDSGSIEQDADVILFLWRPKPKFFTFIELIVGKQRNGVTIKLALQADYKYMTFHVTDKIPVGVSSDAVTRADAAWGAAMGEDF